MLSVSITNKLPLLLKKNNGIGMRRKDRYTALGMAFGMCFGMILGSAVKQIDVSMGLCLGMLLGLVIGTFKDRANYK